MNKTLKILIADTNFSSRLHIEKALNRLGYFCILPVDSFAQLCVLSTDSAQDFDVLIADEHLIIDSGIELKTFCKKIKNIAYKLFYDHRHMSSITNPFQPGQTYMSGSNIPSEGELNDFISLITQDNARLMNKKASVARSQPSER